MPGNVSGVLDANGNVVTGLDYYTVQGSYGIMKDKDGKIVPNYRQSSFDDKRFA